jgi:hypothetical protein
MAKKKKRPWNDKDVLWAKAKRLCRLNVEDVRMAKELGMNPRKLIKNIPNKSEPWKAPVKIWVRDLYRKRQEKAARKKQGGEAEAKRPVPPRSDSTALGDTAPSPAQPMQPEETAGPPPDASLDIDPLRLADDNEVHPWLGVKTIEELMDLADREAWSEDDTYFNIEDFEMWDRQRPPTRKEVVEQNEGMLQRQEGFRIAARHVADEFAQVPEVAKVVLFGSVALPLRIEVPRFRKFRDAGIAVRHECKDVDIAVWVRDMGHCAGRLRKARNRAIQCLLEETGHGVAPHQIEVFLFDAASDSYLGRVCEYNQCPKGKQGCSVPKCGRPPFVRQHEDFTFDHSALRPDKTVVLFECFRDAGDDDLPF